MIAYCGPGRRLLTALTLLLDGEHVTAIYETRHLPDPGAIYLIDQAVFDLPEFEFLLPPRPEAPPDINLPGPLITGGLL